MVKKYKTVYELLKDKKRWCKDASARDVKGISVNYSNRNAVSWCLYGALLRVYGGGLKMNVAQLKLCNTIHENPRYKNETEVSYNDAKRRTHEQVLAMVKKAKI